MDDHIVLRGIVLLRKGRRKAIPFDALLEEKEFRLESDLPEDGPSKSSIVLGQHLDVVSELSLQFSQSFSKDLTRTVRRNVACVKQLTSVRLPNV